MTDFDCVIIGGGPAGLSAGLNLVRLRRRVLIVDGNRPRHSATLVSHGYLTRDGSSPLELRKLGREEFERYETAEFHQAQVTAVTPHAAASDSGGELRVVARGIRGASDIDVTSRVVLLAHGLKETLPALPSVRAYYGTSLHSCVECDSFEKAAQPLALLGESDDLYERALLVSQVTDDLIVFTNGSAALDGHAESDLVRRGIQVEHRRVADVVGERGVMTGVQLADGEIVPRAGGFVRPQWSVPLDFCADLSLAQDSHGYVVVDAHSRTNVPGVYAAGDITPPGPQQLVIAAGSGARAAMSINRFLVG